MITHQQQRILKVLRDAPDTANGVSFEVDCSPKSAGMALARMLKLNLIRVTGVAHPAIGRPARVFGVAHANPTAIAR